MAAAADRLHAWWAGDGSALNDADKLFKQLPGTDFERVSGRGREAGLKPGSCAYGDIAGVIGVPRGAQAVGNALRRNPVLLMTPCHRVLPASALEAAKRAKRLGGKPYEAVGGFSGAMTGPLTDLKAAHADMGGRALWLRRTRIVLNDDLLVTLWLGKCLQALGTTLQ